MGLESYNFDPEYSVEEFNIHQPSIVETTAQPSPFSVRLHSFFGTLRTHKNIVFVFYQKCVENFMVL